MMERTFFDTNILLYADDADSGHKRRRAQSLIDDALTHATGAISTQVLQEYFVNATRKLGLRPNAARERIESLLALEVIVVSPELITGAIDLHRLHQLSFWDALVVKAASESGCRVLLSEDLQHGQRIQGVRFENPFL